MSRTGSIARGGGSETGFTGCRCGDPATETADETEAPRGLATWKSPLIERVIWPAAGVLTPGAEAGCSAEPAALLGVASAGGVGDDTVIIVMPGPWSLECEPALLGELVPEPAAAAMCSR